MMRHRVYNGFFILILLATLTFPVTFAAAQEDETADLKRQIEELKARVQQLEQEKQQPSVPGGAMDQQVSPFFDIQRMQEEMDRMFNNLYDRHNFSAPLVGTQMPEDDIQVNETGEGYEVTMDLKGLDQNKVDVKINDHSLTVNSQYSKKESQQNPQGSIHQESFGSFMRTIPLPLDADTSKMKTEKKGDSLVIQIPKK